MSRLHVDWTRCDGHGACVELLPELMARDDWGFPIVLEAAVPRHLQEHARRAVEVCPFSALKLVATKRQ